MPELSRFFGITITMQYLDCGQHNEPHIHAKYGYSKASIALDGTVLAGALSKKQLAYIRKWMNIHQDELVANWNKAIKGCKIDRIEPLEEA